MKWGKVTQKKKKKMTILSQDNLIIATIELYTSESGVKKWEVNHEQRTSYYDAKKITILELLEKIKNN